MVELAVNGDVERNEGQGRPRRGIQPRVGGANGVKGGAIGPEVGVGLLA